MGDKRKALSLAALLILVVGGGAFLYYSGFFSACTSEEALRSYISRSAPYSHLVFFLLQLLSVILAPIPSNISAAAGGMLFGALPAFFLTFSAVVAGSFLVFALSRVLGQSFADQFVSRHISAKYQQALHAKATTFLTLAFLFPYFPDDILCILAGLSDIPFRRFALIVLLARPWGLLFASGLGGASFSLPPWGLVLIGLIGITCFLLGMKYAERLEGALLRRFQSRKH